MSASEKKTTAGISTLPFHLLPKDIIVNILPKLPAKSLVRFKCVSKFFYALIAADHDFGVLHRSVSLTLPSRAGILIVILLRTPLYTPSVPVLYTINFSEENRRPERQLQANYVGYLEDEPFEIDHLRSSSDGLVCLHRKNRRLLVWNFSTRQRFSLPRIPPSITYAMLGFDLESKRYKALVSAPTIDPGDGGRRRKYKHWVLTVGVDKSWREISNNNGSHLFYTCDGYGYPNYPTYSDSVYINGVIYFYNCTWMTEVHPPTLGIVAFEVGSESFSVIPHPDVISSQNSSRHAFGLLQVDGGRLAIFREMDQSWLNIWTWEKFKKCWERIDTIIPLKESSTINELRFTTNHAAGEIVLLCINGKQLSILVYNLKSKVWKTFDVDGVEEFPSDVRMRRTIDNPIVCPSDVRMYRTMDNVFSLEY